MACQRMDRALREFRIRGVKTNIPFLENVVNHPTFPSGQASTTRFLDETPELFRFAPRQDRATKLLTFLGDVIVNGNPEVAGKPVPQKLRQRAGSALAFPVRRRRARDRFSTELGPDKFAEWTTKQKRLLITDTTLARCASVAHGDARAHLRHGGHRQLRRAPDARALQPRNVGRRDVRRGDALPARGSRGSGCAGCASSCRTSASRCCCARRTPSATRPIRTMSCASS